MMRSARKAMTLVELMFAFLVGFTLLFAATQLLAGARRGEYRTNQAVDVAEEVGQAVGWITRDLQALDHAPDEVPVRVDAGTGAPESHMQFRVRDGDRTSEIDYAFDAEKGELKRTTSSGHSIVFALGKTASVLFRPVDPSFAGGGAVQLGQFNNRLVYRLTARRDGPLGAKSYTLIGAVPYVLKASRDTFRFWNKPAPLPPQV